MRHLLLVPILLSAIALPLTAYAVPIQGQFSVYGTSIEDGGSFYIFDPAFIRVGAGDTIYGSFQKLISPGEATSLTTIFSYDPYFPGSAVFSIGSTKNVMFTLDSLTLLQDGGLFGFEGQGIFTTNVAGFDTTPGEILFSSQGTGVTTFSATFTATPDTVTPTVPEPSTLVLLGTGAMGVAGVIRRRYVAASKSVSAA